MSLKASISGIRGIVGESLTPEVLINYLSAFSQVLPQGKILIGRDSRVTGEMILTLTKSIMNFCGRDVVDIGIIPTPVVLFGVLNGDFAGGIIITASHNPQQWNALKFVNNKGKFLSPAEFAQMSNYYTSKGFKYSKYDKIGKCYSSEDIATHHINAVKKAVDVDKIKSHKIKVALDTVNGAGGDHTIRLLKEFGCEIVSINTDPTGLFAHQPEPTPANLTQLSNLIKENDVDVGFALDPDGDRLVIADGNGNIISEEFTLALCVKQFLTHHKKTPVVINLSSSRITIDIAESCGESVYKEPTGEINVTEKMEAVNSLIGGEGNGGIISFEVNKCRDASVGIAYILEMLSMTNDTLANIVSNMPKYSLIKEKFPITDINLADIEAKLRNMYPNGVIDSRDGIRLDIDKEWLLIRKSNTEPIVRIFAEATTETAARSLINVGIKICGIN